MSGDDVICLATASTPFEAHLWQQALEEADIYCKVVGDYLDAGVGDISGLQAELWVHREDVAAADEILNRSPEGAGPPTDDSTV